MLGATWGDETFQIPYGECYASASAHRSEWELDWVSKEPTPSKKPKEPECMGVAPEPSRVEQGLPPRMAAPKLGLDVTMELLSRVLGAGDEDLDLSALSAALKAKLELSDMKKLPPTMSPGVELFRRDM